MVFPYEVTPGDTVHYETPDTNPTSSAFTERLTWDW